MSILTEEQTKEILNGAIEQIREAVIDEATKGATWRVQESVGSAVNRVVTTFVQEELAPEIITCLREKKSVLIEAAIAGAEGLAVQLAEAMTTQLAENLGTSYKRKKILEAMFE